jgi:hypothetical protein
VGFENDVDVYTCDMGVELSEMRELGTRWLYRPFIGLGGGARTYVFDAPGLADNTCTAGYGALGSELQLGRRAFRVEARDNLFCYRSPNAGVESKTGSEIRVSVGSRTIFR